MIKKSASVEIKTDPYFTNVCVFLEMKEIV